MAINRSIITWEVVFEAKRYDEILNMLITNYKAIYGADIDLSVNVADGEYIRLIADMLYDFSLLAGDVYNSFDINNAKGALLDNLVLLSGNLIRKVPLKTKLNCTIAWTGSDITYIPVTDQLRIQDNLNRIWKMTPNPDLTGTILAAGDEIYLECIQNGDFILEEPILEITKNGSFVTSTGITITNKIIELKGSVAETDAALRARKKESLSYNSSSLVDSIREEVLNNVYSLQDIKIYDSNFDMNAGVNPGINVTVWNGTDAIIQTIPLHDVFILVKPQEGVTVVQTGPISLALVDVLKRKITLGISTYQADITVSGGGNDDNYHSVVAGINPDFPGYTEIYRYYVAQPYNPAIQVHIETLGTAYNAVTTLARIQEALYNLSVDYPINKNLSIAEITKSAFENGNIDPTQPTFEINSIVITGGNTVNNGYWFVDGIDDVLITIVED